MSTKVFYEVEVQEIDEQESCAMSLVSTQNILGVTFLSPIAFVITIIDYQPVRYLTEAVSQYYFYCNVSRHLRENGIVTAFGIQLRLALSTVKSNSN